MQIQPHRDSADVPRLAEMMPDQNVGPAVAVHVGHADTAGCVVGRVRRVVPGEISVSLRQFAKRSATIVDEKMIARIASGLQYVAAGDEQVRPTVASHVSGRNTQTGRESRQTNSGGHVLKLEAAKIPQQLRAAAVGRP